MTKDEWVWVAVRIFGIYLLVLAVTALPGLVSSGFGCWVYRDIQTHAFSGLRVPDAKTEALDTAVELLAKSMQAHVGLFLARLVRVVLFSLVGVYLLKKGGLVFRLVNPAVPGGGRGEAASSSEPETAGDSAGGPRS